MVLTFKASGVAGGQPSLGDGSSDGQQQEWHRSGGGCKYSGTEWMVGNGNTEGQQQRIAALGCLASDLTDPKRYRKEIAATVNDLAWAEWRNQWSHAWDVIVTEVTAAEAKPPEAAQGQRRGSAGIAKCSLRWGRRNGARRCRYSGGRHHNHYRGIRNPTAETLYHEENRD